MTITVNGSSHTPNNTIDQKGCQDFEPMIPQFISSSSFINCFVHSPVFSGIPQSQLGYSDIGMLDIHPAPPRSPSISLWGVVPLNLGLTLISVRPLKERKPSPRVCHSESILKNSAHEITLLMCTDSTIEK